MSSEILTLKQHFILTKQFEIQPPKQGIHSNKSFSNEKVVVPMWAHGESKSAPPNCPHGHPNLCACILQLLLLTFGLVPLSCNALASPNVLYIYILYTCKCISYILGIYIYACKRQHIVQVLLRLAKNSSTKIFPNGSNIKEKHLKANRVVT